MEMTWDSLLCESRIEDNGAEDVGETSSDWKKVVKVPAFEKDYQQLVSSSVMRALQDKTQVFSLDSSDFVRTRLTHSLEVAAIARHIGVALTEHAKSKGETYKEMLSEVESHQDEITSVLETAGLLHDIGNPPFGHKGEDILRAWIERWLECHGNLVEDEGLRRDLRQVEGNAQTLRLLMAKQKIGDLSDANPTYAVLSAMAKYTGCASRFNEGQESASQSDGKKKPVWRHKPGFYYSEKEEFEKIATALRVPQNDGCFVRNPLAFLVEAADDIAYCTADFEDAFAKGLIGLDEIRGYKKLLEKARTACREWEDEKWDEWILEKAFEELISKLDGTQAHDIATLHSWRYHIRLGMIYVAVWSFAENYQQIMDGRYSDELLLTVRSFHAPTVLLLKEYMKKYVYGSSQVKMQDVRAGEVLPYLLDIFAGFIEAGDESDLESEEFNRLPFLLQERIKKATEGVSSEEFSYYEIRAILDYVSLLTDSRACDLFDAYKTLLATDARKRLAII